MKVSKPVLFAVMLSCFPLTMAQLGHASRRGISGPLEPSEPVSGLATVISVQDAAQGKLATVRLTLVSHTADSAVAIHEYDQRNKTSRQTPLASLNLKRGETGTVVVSALVSPDQTGHLFFKVKTRGADGSSYDLVLYTREPAGSDPCESVDEYIQCPGEAGTEVAP